MIKIKKIKNGNNKNKLWYSEMEDQIFPLVLDTKKGYLVRRDEEDNKMYLVKHNHAILLEDDDIV